MIASAASRSHVSARVARDRCRGAKAAAEGLETAPDPGSVDRRGGPSALASDSAQEFGTDGAAAIAEIVPPWSVGRDPGKHVGQRGISVEAGRESPTAGAAKNLNH